MRRKLLALSWILALALVLTEPALAGNGGIAPPAESPSAKQIQDAYWLILGITGAIFLLVETALIVFIIRFRNRGRPREEEGPQIRGHTRLEIIWTVIPVIIIAVIVSFVFYKYHGIKNVPAAGPAGPKMTVHVEGRQFYWRFTYPNGAIAVNELRVPAQRPIELVITAPVHDVAHSWWVPALGPKMDAIPGKTNHTWFLANHTGTYEGKCAEFCGIQHSLMLSKVRAVPEAEFETWVSAQLNAGAQLGKQTFQGACGPCHGMNGGGLIGPPLQGNATLADRVKLLQLLDRGKGAMPPVGRGWNTAQLNALAAYVKKEFASGG